MLQGVVFYVPVAGRTFDHSLRDGLWKEWGIINEKGEADFDPAFGLAKRKPYSLFSILMPYDVKPMPALRPHGQSKGSPQSEHSRFLHGIAPWPLVHPWFPTIAFSQAIKGTPPAEASS